MTKKSASLWGACERRDHGSVADPLPQSHVSPLDVLRSFYNHLCEIANLYLHTIPSKATNLLKFEVTTMNC